MNERQVLKAIGSGFRDHKGDLWAPAETPLDIACSLYGKAHPSERSRVQYALKNLCERGLAERYRRGRYRLTDEGRKLIESTMQEAG